MFQENTFSEIVVRFQERGLIKADCPRRAIFQLGALITEPLQTEILLGVEPEDMEKAIDEQIETGVAAFWKIYGVDQGARDQAAP